MLRFASAFLFVGLLAGCASTLKIVKPDPTSGLYSTNHALTPTEVRVAESFTPAYGQMVYVKVNAERPSAQFVDFFVDGVKETHAFKQVLTKDDLQTLIIERNLGSKVPTVSDLVSLNNLSKEIGPFLIVEPDAIWQGGYYYKGTIKAIDASTGKTVLMLDKTAFNAAGLDEPLFHPLLNGFINWTHNRPVSYDASTTASAQLPARSSPR